MIASRVIVEARRRLGQRLAAKRQAAGYSQAAFAPLTGYSRSTLANVEIGRQHAPRDFWQRCDLSLGDGGAFTAGYDELEAVIRQEQEQAAGRLRAQRQARAACWSSPAPAPAGPGGTGRAEAQPDDELDALELVRRVAASDVGEETVSRLEAAVDDLATSYPVTPPVELLRQVRQHLSFVARLIDARKTLREHQRLLVVGGWLSLLGATLDIDLKQRRVATARLQTAASLAEQTGHVEIAAWCLETRAWSSLTDGDYASALELSQAAQRLAPRGSSIRIQATAQEGRAWARLGRRRETYDALDRVARLVSPLPQPDRAEHHYRYDPGKAVACTTTTLAWLHDPAAEGYARDVIRRLEAGERTGKWPRRVAAAQLDLGLALLAADKYDEACAVARRAVESGRVVPSNQLAGSGSGGGCRAAGAAGGRGAARSVRSAARDDAARLTGPDQPAAADLNPDQPAAADLNPDQPAASGVGGLSSRHR
jgi:transcriptional regulator with XRE-family HTH domain